MSNPLSRSRLGAALARLIASRKAATAMEYGLISALVAVAVMGALSSIGSGVNTTFAKTSSGLGGGGPASTPASPAVPAPPRSPPIVQ